MHILKQISQCPMMVSSRAGHFILHVKEGGRDGKPKQKKLALILTKNHKLY